MMLKKRFAKRVSGNQDYESILNENYEINKVGMNMQFSSDMQNAFSWCDRRGRVHEMSVVIIRFIEKRLGRKFDDVYSEFCKKYVNGKYRKIHTCREQFLDYLANNKDNITIENGIIVRIKNRTRCKDIVITSSGEYLYIPNKANWNAGRRLLIPLIGHNNFKYFSENKIDYLQYLSIRQKISRRLDQQILDEFNTINNFHQEVNETFFPNGICLESIMSRLYMRHLEYPVEKVYKFGTPEYYEYKRQYQKELKNRKKSKFYNTNEYENDIKKHNIKMVLKKYDERPWIFNI